MAAITLAQAQAQLDAWLAASLAVAAGQSYEIAGRRLSRVDAAHIDKMLLLWEGKVNQITASATTSGTGGIRARAVTPYT